MQKRMPQQLKIFLIKLVVLFVIAAIVATMFVLSTRVTANTSTYAFPDVSGVPAFEFGGKVLNRLSSVEDGEEIYKEYTLVEENANYELYFSQSDLDVALVHKASGEIWFSNPNEQTISASTGMSARMRSQLIIRTVDKTSESISTKNTYTDSLAYQKDRDENNLDEGKDTLKQYYITTNPKGGLRVIYIIGQVPLKYNFPVLVPEARYNELLAAIEANGGLTARMLTEANYKLVNSTIWADTTSTTITNDQKANILANAPNIEDLLAGGGGYYVLHSVSIWQNRLLLSNMENYFAESGITAEEMQEYDDMAGFISDNSNLFMVPLDYYLEDDGLKVSVQSDEIEYDDSRFDITSISVMEYFGSADSSEEGYIVVPDGSGALINFNNGKIQLSSEMSIPLYGEDRGKGNIYDKAPAITEQGYLPVWGIKKETSSLFCIIEGADAVATIKADVNRGTRSPSNKAWAEFQYVGSDDVSFLGLDQTLTAYQEEPIKEDIEVKYSILPASEGNEYSDMARYYREYLINRGQLREQTAKEHIPFNLELEGAIDAYATAFGVGYFYINPLTTYSQAQEILSALTDGGVENIAVRYRGWANQGLYNRYWNRIRLLSEMGSKDELNQLKSYAAANNIDIFYDAELITVGTANMLDGFFSYTDASREISKSNAFYKQFNLMEGNSWSGAFIVKPAKVSSAAKTLLEDFNKMELNSICLGRMGEVLTGDYNVNELKDRNEVKKIYAEVNQLFENAGFKIANVGANSYMLGGTSVLFELPNTSSTHYMTDESIPFYQMVVHGLIGYSGEAINQSGDPQRSLLNAVEYGAGLFYRWMYADDIEMYDNYYEDMYALNYVSWLDNAIESYNRYNEELGHTAQLVMTNHKRLSEDLSLTEYEDGTQVYVNYSDSEITVDGVTVPANDYFVVRKGLRRMYKPRSRKLDLMTKRSLWGWLFVLPFIVGFLVFIMSPLYTSLMMSFKESTSVSVGAIQESDGMIANSTIVTRTALVDRGLANYRRAFMQDTSYITALKNVATGELFYIPAILIFSFIIANVLNQQFVGRGVARAIFFMPVVTSTGATSSMLGNNWAIHQMSNGTSASTTDMGLDIVGMLENTLQEINGLGDFASFITSAFGELSNIISISGVQILIFLAALQTISPALFEASDVEGATKWEAFWKITFPMVSPMILVNAMYTMIDVFTGQNNAVIAKLFSTINSTSTTVSQAMAMSWAYFVMVAVVIFAVSGIISKFVYNENE